MRLTGILLAAGASRRFGRDKRKLRLPNGEWAAVHCARRLRSALGEVLAVLREDDAELAAALIAIGCKVAHNPDADEGMAASIRCAVRSTEDRDGWLVMPADLPLIGENTVRHVAERLGSASAVVPVHDGKRGHPVGLSASFREGLLALDGDQGARQLLQARAREVAWLDVDDPGIFRDVDREEDWTGVLRDLSRQRAAKI